MCVFGWTIALSSEYNMSPEVVFFVGDSIDKSLFHILISDYFTKCWICVDFLEQIVEAHVIGIRKVDGPSLDVRDQLNKEFIIIINPLVTMYFAVQVLLLQAKSQATLDSTELVHNVQENTDSFFSKRSCRYNVNDINPDKKTFMFT